MIVAHTVQRSWMRISAVLTHGLSLRNAPLLRHLFRFCLLLLSSHCTIAMSQSRDDILKASTMKGRADAFRLYFEHIQRPAVLALKFDSNEDIALQAAWEAANVDVVTIDSMEAKLNPNKIHWFLGFLEGRMQTDVPKWWGERLLAARIYAKNTTVFPPASQPKAFINSLIGLQIPTGISIRGVANERVSVEDGKRIMEVDRHDLEVDEFVDRCTPYFGEECCYVIFDVDSGFPCVLKAFSIETGRNLWSAQLWAAGRLVSRGAGYHEHCVVEQGDSVFVWGAESHGVYMERLSSQTGKVLSRFCSCYWFSGRETWAL